VSKDGEQTEVLVVPSFLTMPRIKAAINKLWSDDMNAEKNLQGK
jgi:hypothetical protein